MKLPARTLSKPGPDHYERAALRAMEKGDEKLGTSDAGDGSNRLLRYCRAAKRFGFIGDDGIRIVRIHLVCKPLPKEYTDEQIRKRLEDADVNAGDACDSDDIPPWEKQADSSGQEKARGQSKEKEAPPLVAASEVLSEAAMAIGRRDSEVIFDCGWDLNGLEVGPGKITIIGAPPGAGKTSLASQILFAALASHPELQCVIANAEMMPRTLINREIARVSRTSFQKIRFATFSDQEEEIIFKAITALQPLVNRIKIMMPPYSIVRLIESLPEAPGLLVVDYLQKFRMTGTDALEGLETVMGWLRWIASAGWAVIALSSTARQQGPGGKHSPKGLDMGSFRGSGEIEFQADAAYVLRDQSEGAEGDKPMLLDCVKNRHGAPQSLDLTFIREEMRFEAVVARHADFDEYG